MIHRQFMDGDNRRSCTLIFLQHEAIRNCTCQNNDALEGDKSLIRLLVSPAESSNITLYVHDIPRPIWRWYEKVFSFLRKMLNICVKGP